MANISIRLGRVTGSDALAKVETALTQVGAEDELNISMEAGDAHRSDEIMRLLTRENFDFHPTGSRDGEEYVITARRTARST